MPEVRVSLFDFLPAADSIERPSVTFEPMTPAAADILAEALAQVDPWARYGFSPSALTDYLAGAEPGAPRFSIFLNDQLAGAIGVRLNWLRGPYLQFLGILPACQLQGVGSRALTLFESDARAANAQNLWVATSDFNTRALAFYERHGFGRVAVLDGLIEPSIAELLLRKRLTAP